MAENNKKWYVLRAISGKEAKVKEYIEADVKLRGLTDKVSQVLIPTEKVVTVRNGKRIVKEKSYLPGYVLVEAELVGDIAFMLRHTPNVLGFLGGMEQPTPIRQSEINRILGTVDELQETPEETSLEFALGEVTALPQSSLELSEKLEQLRWLENGYKIGVGVTDIETIGIDTPEDLEKAEAFLKLRIKN